MKAVNAVWSFLKSSTGHKVFGLALGAASSYFLTGHVDLSGFLSFFGAH